MTELSKNLQSRGSCRSCLYTGVTTCVGLSGYFLYLAIDEDGPRAKKQLQTRDGGTYYPRNISNMGGDNTKAVKTHGSKSLIKNIESSIIIFMQGQPVAKRNRPFLFALSAFCAASGAFRLYLN
jgi:hypothetical protein